MKNLLLIFSVLLSTSLYAQIGADGTGTVNGYSIGPGAVLSFADLSGADLSGANLSSADLRYADFSGTDLSGADLRYADFSGTDLSGANLSNVLSTPMHPFLPNFYNATFTNVISQSDYDAVVTERDTALAAQAIAEAERVTAMELAETLQIHIEGHIADLFTVLDTLDSVEAERDAALAAQATAEAERDAKLTLDEVKDLRAGSTMIEIDNGQATLSMEVEESDDLGVWTNESATSIQITKDAEAGKKFFRFKMNDSDFDLNDLTLSVGDTEYDETAIKAALAEQYDVPVESISLSVNPG